VEFDLEIPSRTKVMIFQTIGGEMWGKVSKNDNSGRKYRVKLIFGQLKIGLMLIGKVEFGLEIRTRTKVMIFQTIVGKFGGKCGGNMREKLLTTVSLEGSIGQN
jgi:hypothetical protein